VALALVQQGDSGNVAIGLGSASQVLPVNATAGNAVCVAVVDNSGSISAGMTLTSSMGTFTRVNAVEQLSGFPLSWWVCLSVTAGDTVTFNDGGGSLYIAYGYEYSGGFGPTASSGGNFTGVTTSPSLTIACAIGDAVLALAVARPAPGTFTTVPLSPWVNSTQYQLINANLCEQATEQIAGGISETASWIASANSNTAVCGLVLTPGTPPYAPLGRSIYSQAVNRGANFMRRANGLLTPREGLVLPRLALR
jgi:hypothetical protein